MTFLKQWRFWLSLLLFVFCFYFIQPNFDSKKSDFKINFGLDIQGGYSYLLELNKDEFKINLFTKTIQTLKKIIKTVKITNIEEVRYALFLNE